LLIISFGERTFTAEKYKNYCNNNFLEYIRKVATNYTKYNYMNYYNNIKKK